MTPEDLKSLFKSYRQTTETFEGSSVQKSIKNLFSETAKIKLCHPFGTLKGGEAFYQTALTPLYKAMPDLERRDMIALAGTTPEGQDWVGFMGNYMGTFTSPFLLSLIHI